jgi:hypothetical protein
LAKEYYESWRLNSPNKIVLTTYCERTVLVICLPHGRTVDNKGTGLFHHQSGENGTKSVKIPSEQKLWRFKDGLHAENLWFATLSARSQGFLGQI